MNAGTARLVHRGATVLSKHLWRNEEFQQLVEKLQPNLSATEVDALVKSEMEQLQRRIEVNGTEAQQPLLDLMRTDELAAAERIFDQLDALDDAPLSTRNRISGSASGAVSDDPVIREIIDAVSDGTDAAEIREIVSKIREFDLDTHDIIAALKQEITSGAPHTPSEAFDPQDLNDNCVQALSKVIAAQFGRHVPEGVITLHALLEGRLPSVNLLYGECLNLIVAKFCPYTPIGTFPLQLTLTLEDLGIPVDIDYEATLEDAAAKLAEGKLVMVGLNVKPLAPWNGQDGGHVVQLVDIDWEAGTVTVIDTGIRDSAGNPNGNHIVYDLEEFRKAMSGHEIIFTRESPPSVAGAEPNATVSERTSEMGDIPPTSAWGESGEADVELTDLLNAYAPLDSESERDPADRREGSDAASEGDTTDATLNNALSAKSDEGDPSKNNVEEISEATPEVPSPGYVPDNTANSASPVSPGVEGQDDGDADVSGF